MLHAAAAAFAGGAIPWVAWGSRGSDGDLQAPERRLHDLLRGGTRQEQNEHLLHGGAFSPFFFSSPGLLGCSRHPPTQILILLIFLLLFLLFFFLSLRSFRFAGPRYGVGGSAGLHRWPAQGGSLCSRGCTPIGKLAPLFAHNCGSAIVLSFFPGPRHGLGVIWHTDETDVSYGEGILLLRGFSEEPREALHSGIF